MKVILGLLIQILLSSGIYAQLSDVVRCLNLTEKVAKELGMATVRPAVPGAIILKGKASIGEYSMILRFAVMNGQVHMASASQSNAAILEERTLAVDRFYKAFWTNAEKNGLEIVPISDFQGNADLIGEVTQGVPAKSHFIMETCDKNVVAFNLSNGKPEASSCDWGIVEQAGFGVELIGNAYHLFWMVFFRSESKDIIEMTVDEVSGSTPEKLIHSKARYENNTAIVQGPATPISKEKYPWLFNSQQTIRVFRIILKNAGGNTLTIYQPALYSAEAKNSVLETIAGSMN